MPKAADVVYNPLHSVINGDTMFPTMTSSRKPGRPRKHEGNEDLPRSGQNVHVYLDPTLMAAFEDYRSSLPFKPRKTEVLEKSLRAFLEAEGFWPPK